MSDLTDRDTAPPLAEAVAARGNNLVFLAPPAPGLARPVLAGILNGGGETLEGPWLALAPAEAISEWARVAEQVGRGTGKKVAGAHTPARLARLLGSDTIGLIVTSPGAAHELVRRAALKLGSVAGVLLLWPEAWGGDEVASVLLQEVPKDTQRILVSADPAGSAPLIERYCWRAPVTDLLGPEPLSALPQVRSTPVAWGRRREALVDLVEQLDPQSLAVWTADPAEHEDIGRALAAAGASAELTSGVPTAASLIVAYDLPSPSRLREVAAAGSVVLLVPPGTEGYAARLAPNRRPIHSQGPLEAAQAGLARSRRSVAELLERGPAPGGYFAIAPLLERYEATAVAAALYQLWEEAAAARTATASAPRATAVAAKLWLAVGKRDAATTHDVVAALIKEGGVSRDAIGKVEIRETFSLVELGAAADPEQVAEKLTGKTIKKRRLVARVDKGRPARRE